MYFTDIACTLADLFQDAAWYITARAGIDHNSLQPQTTSRCSQLSYRSVTIGTLGAVAFLHPCFDALIPSRRCRRSLVLTTWRKGLQCKCRQSKLKPELVFVTPATTTGGTSPPSWRPGTLIGWDLGNYPGFARFRPAPHSFSRMCVCDCKRPRRCLTARAGGGLEQPRGENQLWFF